MYHFDFFIDDLLCTIKVHTNNDNIIDSITAKTKLDK